MSDQEQVDLAIARQLGTSISNNAKLYARIGNLRNALVAVMNSAAPHSEIANFCEKALEDDKRQSVE